MTVVTGTIQLRRGTAALWTSTNPTLLEGEQGFETDTKKTKTGDGVTLWNDLEYDSSLPNGGTTGQVLAKASDTDNDTEWVDVSGGGGGLGYTLEHIFNAFNPVDATTYYSAVHTGFSPVTAVSDATARSMSVPKDGTITAATFLSSAFSTTGSNESTSVYVQVYNSTNVLQSETLVINTLKFNNPSYQNSYLVTGLNIPVVAGQNIILKWITPTWITNPTLAWFQGYLYIE